jgi:hypothetical protein
MVITSVKPLPKFKVRLKFKNGVTKTVDLSDRLNGPLFSKLRSRKVFARVKVDEAGGLEWPNGADICPDLLYYGGAPPWAR